MKGNKHKQKSKPKPKHKSVDSEDEDKAAKHHKIEQDVHKYLGKLGLLKKSQNTFP